MDPFHTSRKITPEALGPNSLEGKVALVTGSSAGIGEAVARELSLRGAKVVINYPFASLKAEADAVGKSLKGEWVAIEADIGSLDGPSTLVAATVERFGKIDILVNNVARVLMAPFEVTNLELWTTSMDVNARGAFLTTQAVLPHFPSKSSGGGGRIINVTSSAARVPEPMQCVYAASKAAMDAMAKVWTLELPPKYGCTVNSVAPGIILTQGSRVSMAEHIDFLKPLFDGRTPSDGWFGLPEDIAWSVAFLAEERSSWVNGAVINVSGGMFLT